MTEEQFADELRAEKESSSEAAKTAAKVAASTVLATSLVGALSEPPNVEMMSLPEPVPIVQTYYAVDEDDDVDDEDRQNDSRTSRWRRLLRILKYLIVALALMGALLFGVLRGCAGIAVGVLPPAEDERQEQTTTHTRKTNEDERGVATE